MNFFTAMEKVEPVVEKEEKVRTPTMVEHTEPEQKNPDEIEEEHGKEESEV